MVQVRAAEADRLTDGRDQVCEDQTQADGEEIVVSEHKPVESWLTDMDGVLVHEERAIPGASEFIGTLQSSGRKFLVLTNNSIYTPRDLRARLLAGGINVPEQAIWTSARRPRSSSTTSGPVVRRT